MLLSVLNLSQLIERVNHLLVSHSTVAFDPTFLKTLRIFENFISCKVVNFHSIEIKSVQKLLNLVLYLLD